MTNLTDYQAAQLLYLHFEGEFRYRNSKGNRVSRSAWRKMINALLNAEFIDGQCKVTAQGNDYLDKNHHSIRLAVLD